MAMSIWINNLYVGSSLQNEGSLQKNEDSAKSMILKYVVVKEF